MSCRPELVTGWVDEALDKATRLEVEQHMAECSSCREQADFERELRQKLKGLPAPLPPATLERAVRRQIQAPRVATWRVTLPLAAVLVLGVLWGLGSAPIVGHQLARDHSHCFGIHPLPAQVWSEDPARVAAWIESAGVKAPVLPASAGTLHLVGARQCPLLDRKVVHVYYAGDDRRLSLFVIPGTVRLRLHDRRMRGETVSLLRVEGLDVGVVGEHREDVEAMRRALSTTVAALDPTPQD